MPSQLILIGLVHGLVLLLVGDYFMHMFRSLNFQLFLAFLILVSLMMTGLYILVYQSNLEKMEEEIHHNLSTSSQVLNDTFNSNVKTPIWHNIRFLAKSPLIDNYFDAAKAERRGHRNELERLFIRMIQLNPELLKSIRLFDKDGQQQVAVSGNKRIRQSRKRSSKISKSSNARAKPFDIILTKLKRQKTEDSEMSIVVQSLPNERFLAGIAFGDPLLSELFIGTLLVADIPHIICYVFI